MPELPDIEAYCDALRRTVGGQVLQRLRIVKPFVLRSFAPPVEVVGGLKVNDLERLGKRIVLVLEGDLFVVIHLMIAGRLLWSTKAVKPAKLELALFEFESGTLVLTEAGTKRRASIHLVENRKDLYALSRGGIEPLETTLEQFGEVLTDENRTLKRALTNPSFFSGIGNAYSDEILFAAKLSPVRLTQALSDEEIERLFEATRETLSEWTAKLKAQFRGRFPGRGEITAFREDFAVHGRFGLPCRVCGKPIQHIVHADNETNYCAICQNEGRLLADRALSRLLKKDWPKTLEEMLGGE